VKPTQPLRVVFYPAGGLNNASARTRMYAYLPYLNKQEFSVHIANYTYHKYDRPRLENKPKPSKWQIELLPLKNIWAFLRADVLVFQKKNFARWQIAWAKKLGKRLIYDFDDAIYFYPPDHNPNDSKIPEIDQEFLPKLLWVLHNADLVLVSGDELARFAVQYAKHVQILPSVLTEFAGAPSKTDGRKIIGWVGAPENQVYLREIEEVLCRLQSEQGEIEVWLITSKLIEPAPKFKHRFISWSAEAEREFIPQFTVGIAPLVDNAWCRAKMNFKALVYLSRGVPAIASPVGFPVDSFENGASILLPKTPDDWYQSLHEILRSPTYRQGLAVEGLKVVRETFSAENNVKAFVSTLQR
jgi:hypothetical protein